MFFLIKSSVAFDFIPSESPSPHLGPGGHMWSGPSLLCFLPDFGSSHFNSYLSAPDTVASSLFLRNTHTLTSQGLCTCYSLWPELPLQLSIWLVPHFLQVSASCKKGPGTTNAIVPCLTIFLIVPITPPFKLHEDKVFALLNGIAPVPKTTPDPEAISTCCRNYL